MSSKKKEDLYPVLTEDLIGKYMIQVTLNDDHMMYRDSRYSADEASLKEGRFNPHESPAWYVASGIQTASVEVPGYAVKTKYMLRSGPYELFDALSFGKDWGFEEAIVASQEDGGWEFCQELARRVKDFVPTCSGIRYPSSKMHQDGRQGECIVILHPSKVLEDSTFFIKVT